MVEKIVHGSKNTIPVLEGVFLANIKDSQLDRKSALAPKTQHRPFSLGLARADRKKKTCRSQYIKFTSLAGLCQVKWRNDAIVIEDSGDSGNFPKIRKKTLTS
jgi:hypothetical protein